MRLLTIMDYYLPGFKGGGPIRTMANMVDWLGDEFTFIIFTRDRDLGDLHPYDVSGTWDEIGGAQVRYLTPAEMSMNALAGLINACDYDVLYLNSFFSTMSVKVMTLYTLGRIPRTPLILAPRGEFNAGALALKRRKKQGYLLLTALVRMYRRVVWQASSEDERQTIIRVFGERARIHIAPDMRPRLPDFTPSPTRKSSPLKLVFLGRISPMKNLDYALNVLKHVTVPLHFDIYGPMEDAAYWSLCEAIIADLPPHVRVDQRGTLPPQDAIPTLSAYHLFFLPTRGENFGHVIWESLYAGCPVLISDRTPWRDLGRAGWVLPLDEPSAFAEVIAEFNALDDADFAVRSQSAHALALESAQDDAILQANRELFLKVVR